MSILSHWEITSFSRPIVLIHRFKLCAMSYYRKEALNWCRISFEWKEIHSLICASYWSKADVMISMAQMACLGFVITHARTVLWFCSPAALPHCILRHWCVCVRLGDTHALWQETKAFPPLSRFLEGRSGLRQQLTEEMTTPPVDRGSWRTEGEGSTCLRATARRLTDKQGRAFC